MSSEQAEPDVSPTSVEPPSSGTESDVGSTPRLRPQSRRLLVLLFSVAAVVLVLDIVTKVIAVAKLSGQPPVRLLGGAVYLVLFRNAGAAFSLATGMTWVLALLAIGVAAVIVWLAPKLRSSGWAVGLGMVLGGACGNLVDRIFRAPGPLQGHVVDFISLFAPDGSVWPVFNVADSSIVCGGVLVVLMSVLGRDFDGTRRDKRAAEERT